VYTVDPFVYSKLPQNPFEEEEQEEEQFFLPLVNVTEIQRILDSEWEVKGVQEKVKDTLQIAGVYPRWLGFGNMSYSPSDGSEPKNINTLFNLGDSDLEVKFNVAQGFPNISLAPYEIIIPQTFVDFFEWKEEQP
jgi:hypothetical protein